MVRLLKRLLGSFEGDIAVTAYSLQSHRRQQTPASGNHFRSASTTTLLPVMTRPGSEQRFREIW